MSRTAKKKVRIKDEGIVIADDIDSIDFQGAGVDAIFNDPDAEVDIPGGISGDRYKTTSTTTQTIVPNGNLTFTVDSGLAYTALQDVIIAYDSNNHMHGEVVSYSGTTLVVDIQHKTGSGTYSSWTINLDGVPIEAISGNLTTSRIPYATGINTIGDDEHHVWDNVTKSVGIQVDTPKATVHTSATVGTTINNVTIGSVSLLNEVLPVVPTGSITQIAEPNAGSGGTSSYIDGGTGSAITANGNSYEFRVYPCLLASGTYYRSQYSETLSAGTDPNDSQVYNIALSWGTVSITGETVEYFVEYDMNGSGSWSPIGVFSGSGVTLTSLSGSNSTTNFPTFYNNTPATPAGSPSGIGMSVVNEGSGTFSGSSDGTTWYYELDTYITAGGTKYVSGSPINISLSDNNNGQSYDWSITWTDGSPSDGLIIRRSNDNTNWSYQYISNGGSYTDYGFSNDTDAEGRWGQTYSAGSITYSFNPFGTGTAPSGNTIYSSAGTPYTTSVPADSVNYIFKHTFSGNTTGKVRDDSSSYGYTFTGSQFYDIGYTSWGSGTTVSPNSYGFTGTNQNRDYRVYGYSPSLGIYSQLPLTLSTISSGGNKYVSGSFTYPTGVTQVRITRQVNGGGYTHGKLITSGTTFTDDSTDNSWSIGGATPITPTSIMGVAGRFDKASTSTSMTPAMSVVHIGGGVGSPQLGFGVATDENSDVSTYVARIGVPSTSNGYLQAVTGRFDVGSSFGGTPIAMIGVSNVFNNAQSSSVHFQVKGQNDSNLINTRSDIDTVGFGQAIGLDEQTTVQIHPARAGDVGLVFKGHSSHSGSSIIWRTQTNAGTYTAEFTVGGWLRASTGAVGTPSLSCRSDTNTGIYFPTADTLGFVTGGTERVRIDNGGSVGIGTTNITARVDINQPSLAQPVIRWRSEATNDDPSIFKYQNRVATTDATVTTLHSVATVSNNSYIVEAKVLARRTGGSGGTASDTAGYKIIGVFKNNAGTLTQVGTTTIEHTSEDQAGWNCTFDTSGTTIRVRVTGATNNNVTWHLVELDMSNLSS